MKFLAYISIALGVAAATTPALAAPNAAGLWQDHCSKCHGKDGRGDTKVGHKLYINDLTDASIQSKFTDEEARQSIKVGLKDAKGKMIMKPVEGLSDEEVNALVAYVRSLKK